MDARTTLLRLRLSPCRGGCFTDLSNRFIDNTNPQRI
jgi:hypothetical protein